MITIADILWPQHVSLEIKTSNHAEAVWEVASLLKADERVKDWEGFFSSLQGQDTCIPVGPKSGICIPHGRTDAVSKMVMSVGCLNPGTKASGKDEKVHFIFVIGVPVALTSDYLRIVGALVRIFKETKNQKLLRGLTSPDDFLAKLVHLEMKL
jgi:mannitol/fructose-specific phosphotransferase system IIA component (Ntr-type)